ncbi:uncharacterized protein Triagg1_4912 [Trichoderma aggressivum f. europaeum]|uniref:Uncharacterized protein n=1 Tax=Trichoderma aggressivum f. europaeum TaxID=173218 RepID=A0AAE1M347_9HYPO|nr:hypothetical protein Triagg1_4912 [Trichoderma aggressivum f. europaeum]
MAKRKSAGSVTPPRKKAKLDQPIESPRLQTHSTDAASSSSCSLPSSPLPSTSQRPEKRKILDDTSSEGEDEWDAGSDTKRIRTQSPTNPTRRSPTPGYQWVLHDDNPEAQAHIYWEPTDLTERSRRWRESMRLIGAGYLGCSCGKMHYAIGRKSWHLPGQEPELEDPEESVPERDEEYTPPRTIPAYQDRSQERFPTPELSDEEANVGNTQLNSTPIDVSILQESPTSPDSPAPVVAEVPTVSRVITPTTNTGRVSRRRTSEQRDVEKPKARRQTRRKNKNKEKKEDKGKPEKRQRQPRNRKPKTTPVAEEPAVARRSSRRNAESTMWFLDSNGRACSITASSR